MINKHIKEFEIKKLYYTQQNPPIGLKSHK